MESDEKKKGKKQKLSLTVNIGWISGKSEDGEHREVIGVHMGCHPYSSQQAHHCGTACGANLHAFQSRGGDELEGPHVG